MCNGTIALENIWAASRKVKHASTLKPHSPLQASTQEGRTYVHTKTCA